MLVVMSGAGAMDARGRHYPQGSDVENIPGWYPNHVAMCLKRGILEERPPIPNFDRNELACGGIVKGPVRLLCVDQVESTIALQAAAALVEGTPVVTVINVPTTLDVPVGLQKVMGDVSRAVQNAKHPEQKKSEHKKKHRR